MEKFLYTYQKEKIRLRTVLVFPNSYSIGMSNLGYQWVYHLLQSYPAVSCERAFIESNEGRLLTLESGRDLSSFDLILFSISFEADLPNIIGALKRNNIPLNPKERISPMIVIGGIAASILPLYLKEFADVIFSGDADTILPALIDSALLYGISEKEKIYDSLKDRPGIYLPQSIQENKIPYYRGKNVDPAHSVIVANDTEFSGRGLIEVSKSCLNRCAFCLVTSAYGDYEPVPTQKIISIAEKFRGITAKLGLVAATLSNHPDFKTILMNLNDMGFQLSFSAFRIEDLDTETLGRIIDNENKTLVIAPETASPALKKIIRKMIPNNVILETVRKAARMGIKRIKLYFLIGLPGETHSDLTEIVSLIQDIRKISQEFASDHGYIPEIIVDINPLVPKPFTAFEGLPIEDIKSLKSKVVFLKNNIRNFGRVFVYGESPKNAHLQYKLANHLLSFQEVEHLSD